MRKLIRPSHEEMERLKKQYSHTSIVARHRTPPDATGAEQTFLKLHSQLQTPMVVKIRSGEEIRGWIEYFDLHIIRITLQRGPNRFIYKRDILYIHEDPTAMRRRRIPRY